MGERRKAEEREVERVKKQRGVIEIVPDSQAKESCEGEPLIKMAEEAGVTRGEIESIKMVRGRMRVKVKEGEEEKIVERVNRARASDGKWQPDRWRVRQAWSSMASKGDGIEKGE